MKKTTAAGLALLAATSVAEAAIRRDPNGVNVNAGGATTVLITFGGLRDQVPAEAFWCGELVPAARELWPKAEFPETLEAFWRRCRSEGQRRSSSILICYGEGGINHPHRDIYGKVWFPFQALLMLSKRGRDFEGGEFVLHDEVDGAAPVGIPVSEGDVVAFVSRERIQSSRRRPLRIGVRHGMRTVVRGNRYGLGIVFHLAE